MQEFKINVSVDKAINTPIFHKLGVHKLIKSILNNALYEFEDIGDVLISDKSNYYK